MPSKPSESEVFDALCRTNLSAFIQWSFHVIDPGAEYQHNWHIDLIADRLEKVYRGEIRDLIINVPPGYLKSIAVNVAFTAWVLGHNPSERMISTSHDMDLSEEMSRRVIALMEQPLYKRIFPEARLKTASSKKIVTTKQGLRWVSSLGAKITGKDSNLNIIDDPHDRKDALNPATLKKACVEYEQGVSTRLRDKKRGRTVVIMQRLHTDDLTGHLIKKYGLAEKGGKFHLLRLQGEAEEDEVWRFDGPFPDDPEMVIRRAAGDLLHPSREGAKEIKAMKTLLGTFGYAGQYQQDPIPQGGGDIKSKDLRRYDVRPDRDSFLMIVQSWDTAQKEKELNDPSVCSTFGITEDEQYFLLDVWREKVGFPKLLRTAQDLIKVWRPDAILIEDKVSGTSLIQCLRELSFLIHDVTKNRIPINVIAIEPEQNKIARMGAEAPTVEAGKVWVPGGDRQPHWMIEWEKEAYGFPLVTHDDQVDSLSQFLCWAKRRSTGTVTTPDQQATSVTDQFAPQGMNLQGFL